MFFIIKGLWNHPLNQHIYAKSLSYGFKKKKLFRFSKTGKNGEKHIKEDKNIFFLLSNVKFHHHPMKKPKGIKFGSF